MNQRHRRHGGRGHTLLYYIGLEGKEDKRTKEQKTEEQKNKNRWKGKQEQGGKGQKATTEAAQSGDWKVVAYLESVANSYGWRVKPNARYAFRAHGLAMT